MTPTHYHLKLYYSGHCLLDVERAEDRRAALDRARQYTEHVQAHMGALTYKVRVEPCALTHFPERKGPV